MKTRIYAFRGYCCDMPSGAIGFGRTPANAFDDAASLEKLKAKVADLANRAVDAEEIERIRSELDKKADELERAERRIIKTGIAVVGRNQLVAQLNDGARKWGSDATRVLGFFAAYLQKNEHLIPPEALANIRGYRDMIERALRGGVR